MDFDELKNASDEQMDMLMMMQMDKLSELCGGYTDFPDFCNASTNNNFSGGGGGGGSGSSNIPNFLENISSHEHTFMDIPSNNSNNNNNNMLSFNQHENSSHNKKNSMTAMREMIFRIAAMQPINIDPESVKAPKRKNVKISKDPQSVAARHRRERISERIRILQRLVPGGTKMDTASMLDEAIHYVKFLKGQVQTLERAAVSRPTVASAGVGLGFPVQGGHGYGHESKMYHQGGLY